MKINFENEKNEDTTKKIKLNNDEIKSSNTTEENKKNAENKVKENKKNKETKAKENRKNKKAKIMEIKENEKNKESKAKENKINKGTKSNEIKRNRKLINKKNNKENNKNKVIEVNVGFTVLKIIAIILIISLITAQTVRTIIQAKTTTSEASETEEATYYYVESSDGVQVPVPVGYTASEIEGETGVSTGFVIYEGEVNWEEIGIETTTASVTSIQAQKTVAASETGIVNARYEYSDDYTSCEVTLTSDYEITLIEILEDETEEYTEDTSFKISEDGLTATGEFTENSTNVYKLTYDLDGSEEETTITIEITEIPETETDGATDTRIKNKCKKSAK